MGSSKGFLYRKLVLLSGYFWVSLATLTPYLFRLLLRYCKFQSNELGSSTSSTLSSENNQFDSNCFEIKDSDFDLFESFSRGQSQVGEKANLRQLGEESQVENSDMIDPLNIVSSGEESPKLVFKFQYQTWEKELMESDSENFDSLVTASSSTNKYVFIPGKDLSHVLEELPEVSNLSIKEMHVNPNEGQLENKAIDNSGFLSDRDFFKKNFEAQAFNNGNPTIRVGMEEEGIETLGGGKDSFLSEHNFNGLGTDSDTIIPSPESSVKSILLGSNSDGFLSEIDFELDGFSNKDVENRGSSDEELELEDVNSENLSVGYEPEDFEEEGDRDVTEELRKTEEECQMKNSESPNNTTKKEIVFPDKETKPNSENWDCEDSNGLETLWEHQELIEQLKMELKKVKATGLPTILEESETPKIIEDLKPWKIDEKFQHSDPTNELPRFYKSYRERMRKFDILNYQKMYAIGYLQPKDPLQSFSSQKSSAPTLTSVLSHGLKLCRRKKIESDPMQNFIRELFIDLEMVYVGQLCLSWEFLQWQYQKALELWENDPFGLRRYNEVAGEFQQFQVLLQRFVENEPFQGPRVENYTKKRCLMRNLLQVPVIREDNSKHTRKIKKREKDDENAINNELLVEMLEESIRTIWRFIRADKEAHMKSQRETQIEVQDPSDSEILVDIRADLQKKEKRLKDILRSGNCILKRFQKHQEDGTEHFLYFFSQVDMKLVWRVLNMPRITTEQLTWCHNKLNKISFVNKRIHVEPSLLLFPC